MPHRGGKLVSFARDRSKSCWMHGAQAVESWMGICWEVGRSSPQTVQGSVQEPGGLWGPEDMGVRSWWRFVTALAVE